VHDAVLHLHIARSSSISAAASNAETWSIALNINLDELSLKELKKLERDVSAAIASYETRVKAQALAELDAKARELGFSLAELTGAAVTVKGKRAPATAKYANPANPAETWSGRGRKPAWFAVALAAGTDLADLSV
jgi:DNA-binding protein H-NS